MSEQAPPEEPLQPINMRYNKQQEVSAKKAPRRTIRSRLPGIPHPSLRRNKSFIGERRRRFTKTRATGATILLLSGVVAADKLTWANKGSEVEKYRISEDIKDATCFRDGSYLGPGVVIRSNQGNYGSQLGTVSKVTGLFNANIAMTVGKNQTVKVRQARYEVYEGRTLMNFIFRDDSITPTRVGIADATVVVDYGQATKNGADGKPLITGYDVKSSPPGPLTIACGMLENGRTYIGGQQAAIADTFSGEFLSRLKGFEELER